MESNQTTRRRFLVATIALSSAATGNISSSLLGISSAWAESRGELDAATKSAMVRMARLLFPHRAMSDAFYADVLDNALGSAAGNPSFAAALNAAENALNAARPADWIDLEESEQLAVMREVQDRGFFDAIVGAVRAGIYLNPVFWEHIGYPGSSKEFGGYVDRGSDDIDWLPENP